MTSKVSIRKFLILKNKIAGAGFIDLKTTETEKEIYKELEKDGFFIIENNLAEVTDGTEK
jgi:hypothetical protein